LGDLSIDRDQREKVKAGELEQLPESKKKTNHPVAMLQFRSFPNCHMLNVIMPKSPVARKTSHASIGSKKSARGRATNAKPFPFDWVDLATTEMEYSSVLTRISREYDRRFA
jgi:hypothetical protein